MLKKIITYIEREPWDEAIERQWIWLDRACWLVILLAVLYFGPTILDILTR